MKEKIKITCLILILLLVFFISFNFWKNYQFKLEACKIHYDTPGLIKSFEKEYELLDGEKSFPTISKEDYINISKKIYLETWCKHRLKEELLSWFEFHFPFK